MKYFVVADNKHYSNTSNEDRLFQSLGMTPTTLEKADVVIFPGGSDIDPEIYGEKPLKWTSFLRDRDDFEMEVFSKLTENQWAIGICRGAQFLAVMFGGTLWQHVSDHAGAPHFNQILDKGLADKWGGTSVILNSYHHQMVKKIPTGFTPLVATSVSVYKRSFDQEAMNDHFDLEVAWSKEAKTLLFQGHPEFGHSETEKFFKVLWSYVTEKEGAN